MKLVKAYSELEEDKKKLKDKISEIEKEQEKIAEAAIDFAEREGSQVIDGPDKQLVVTIKEELVAPTRKDNQGKWEGLKQFLIEHDKYTDVSTVNNSMLNRMIKSWPHEVVSRVRDFLVRKMIRKVDLKKKT